MYIMVFFRVYGLRSLLGLNNISELAYKNSQWKTTGAKKSDRVVYVLCGHNSGDQMLSVSLIMLLFIKMLLGK